MNDYRIVDALSKRFSVVGLRTAPNYSLIYVQRQTDHHLYHHGNEQVFVYPRSVISKTPETETYILTLNHSLRYQNLFRNK